MNVYTGYVWKDGKLIHAAHDIVAGNRTQAAQRSVGALLSRRELIADKDLRALNVYLQGMGPCPDGVTLQVVKVVDGPAGGPCVV